MDKFEIANPCTATYFNQEGHIIFDPCLYIQRYQGNYFIKYERPAVKCNFECNFCACNMNCMFNLCNSFNFQARYKKNQ